MCGGCHQDAPTKRSIDATADVSMDVDTDASKQQQTDTEHLGVVSQSIHAEPGCAFRNLGPRGTVAAAQSRYGQWCGPDLWGNNSEPLGGLNGENPQLPVNCWDE